MKMRVLIPVVLLLICGALFFAHAEGVIDLDQAATDLKAELPAIEKASAAIGQNIVSSATHIASAARKFAGQQSSAIFRPDLNSSSRRVTGSLHNSTNSAGGAGTGAQHSGFGPRFMTGGGGGPIVQVNPSTPGDPVWANTATDFNSGGSWIGGSVPGTSDVGTFSSASPAFQPNVTANITIGGVNFTTSGWDLTSNAGVSLTLTINGSNDTDVTSAIRGGNTSGTNTVDASIIFGAAAGLTQTIAQKPGGTLVINGTLTNTNAITLRLGGGGTIDITSDNSATLTAPIRLASGTTLQIGNNNALGSGLLDVVDIGAVIQSDSSADRVLPNNIQISTPSVTFGAGGNLTFGAMTQDGDQTIIVNNSIVTVSSLDSTTSAVRNLTKDGPGALLVTGNRSHGGDTKILAGTFGVAGTFTSQNINLDGGVLAVNDTGLGGPFTRALGKTNLQVQWNSSGGFAAYGPSSTWGDAANNLTVNIGGAGATLTWGMADFLASGDTLILGSPISNGTVTFQNGLNFGATDQTIRVDRGATAPVNGVDAVISGLIGSSGGGLVKTGAGTLSLTANNTYTGPTTINAGILLINGDQSGATGAVAVNNTGTLGGTGTVGGAVTVNAGGTIAPGPAAGVGALSLNSTLTFNGASGNLATYSVDLLGATSDKLTISGALNLTNSFDQIIFNGTADGTTTYVLATYSSVSGTFDTVTNLPGGYELVYLANELDLTPIPEAGTWIAAALAAVVIGYSLVVSRRRLRRVF